MKKVYIIAEIGCNHNGDIKLAYEMVDKAISAGVNAVKFQTFKSEKLVSKFAPKAEYAVGNTQAGESQLEMTKKLELTYEDYRGLFDYVEKQGVDWFSTAFDFESIEFLASEGMKVWKIPSGEITNLPYLEKIGQQDGKIIISNGMSSVKELDKAVEIIEKNGATDITILHCITEYPTPDEEMQLSTIPYFIERYGEKYTIGLSDHSAGYEAAIGAAAMGAVVVEKHFTLDNDMPGPDHKASANPKTLVRLVEGVRKIEKMYGTPKIVATPIETKNITAARKSIVASKDIKIGEVLTEDNITTKRPGNGISPMEWYNVIGTVAKRDYHEDELLK